VTEAIVGEKAERGRRTALVIANGQYQDGALACLASPVADACALREALGDPLIGDFCVDVAVDLVRRDLELRIEEFFQSAQAEDLLLLHLSGHGLRNESGELYFATRDTRPALLLSTAVSSDFLRCCVDSSPSRRIILLLDCCYGGAYSKGSRARSVIGSEINALEALQRDSKRGDGRGRAVITASAAVEFSFEGESLAAGSARPSIFTEGIVHGLVTGDADEDCDGLISLDDLYNYVFSWVTNKRPDQHPQKDFRLQGKMHIAYSGRRLFNPVPLPEDLRRAVASHDVFARRGAVAELQRRLTHDNASVASAALVALRMMVDNDIETIAVCARQALDTLPAPGDLAVDFGNVLLTDLPTTRTIPLDGPPLARAVSVGTSPADLRIRPIENALTVSLLTKPPGFVEQRVRLEGPIGARTLVVTAKVSASAPVGHGGGSAPTSSEFSPAPPPASAESGDVTRLRIRARIIGPSLAVLLVGVGLGWYLSLAFSGMQSGNNRSLTEVRPTSTVTVMVTSPGVTTTVTAVRTATAIPSSGPRPRLVVSTTREVITTTAIPRPVPANVTKKKKKKPTT
jgi:hypothetical protein